MYGRDNESSLNGSIVPSPNSKNLSKSITYNDSSPVFGSPKRKEIFGNNNLTTTEILFMNTPGDTTAT